MPGRNAAAMARAGRDLDRAMREVRAIGIEAAARSLSDPGYNSPQIPVKYGEHRAGVRISAGMPSDFRAGKGEHPPPKIDASEAKSAPLKTKVYLSARGPYMSGLDRHHKTQAGFVKASIRAGRRAVKKSRVKA